MEDAFVEGLRIEEVFYVEVELEVGAIFFELRQICVEAESHDCRLLILEYLAERRIKML